MGNERNNKKEVDVAVEEKIAELKVLQTNKNRGVL